MTFYNVIKISVCIYDTNGRNSQRSKSHLLFLDYPVILACHTSSSVQQEVTRYGEETDSKQKERQNTTSRTLVPSVVSSIRLTLAIPSWGMWSDLASHVLVTASRMTCQAVGLAGFVVAAQSVAPVSFTRSPVTREVVDESFLVIYRGWVTKRYLWILQKESL